MKPNFVRRYRRRSAPAKTEGAFFRKESQHEQNFFGESQASGFFQPAPAIQRKCAECEKEEKHVQRVSDKKEEKEINRAPEKKEEDKKVMKKEEKKEEEKVMKAPEKKEEEKKIMKKEEKKEEEKVMKAPEKKEEEKLMKKEEKKEEEKIQKKENGASNSGGQSLGNYVSSLNGKGQSLPAQANDFFSSKMGYDFSDVKVHTDKDAADSAKGINAKAYTIGNNIVFNEGQYNMESGQGKKLMAHELTHVMQQEGSGNEKNSVQKDDLDAGLPVSSSYQTHANCLVRNGLSIGGIRIAGVISDEEKARINNECRSESGYEGEDFIANEDESRQVIQREFLSEDQGNRLEEAYKETLRVLHSSRANLTSEQIIILTTAYHLLVKGNREVPPPSFVSYEINGVPDGQVHISNETVKFYGFAAITATPTLNWGGGFAGGAAGATAAAPAATAATGMAAGEAAAGTTLVEVGVGAGAATAATIVAVVVVAALIGYGIFKLMEYAGEEQEVDPRIGDKINKAIEDLIKARNPQPEPAPEPEPEPEPIGPSPVPTPDLPPDDDQRKKRKCKLPTGFTEMDAIPIVWYKPKNDLFYPHYLLLMDGVLNRDDPDAALPDGSKVGVKPRFWPSIGKTFQLLPNVRGGKEVEFKKDLSKYGYDWKKEKTSPDHVQDLQWDGPDKYGNFWPLEASVNASAGPMQNQHQRVNFCQTEKGPERLNWSIQRIKDNSAAIKGYGRYFVIVAISDHS